MGRLSTNPKLSARLQRLDAQLRSLEEQRIDRNIPSARQLNKWLNEITLDLPDLPPLPANFSRADIYDDHD